MPTDIKILSSLISPEQRGGAYLRVHALEHIYQRLGLTAVVHYMSEFSPPLSWRGLFYSIYWKKNVRILFQRFKWRSGPCRFIHLDNLRFFSWDIQREGPSKIIYNAHNLEYESYFNRVSEQKEAKAFKKYECQQMNQADYIFVCSEREKYELSSYDKVLGEKVFVIPNLVDQKNYQIGNNKKTILFLGTLDYFPNIGAVEFICRHFYPGLPDEVQKNYRFVIAGRNPLESQRKMIKEAGIELHCDLSDEQVKTLLSETLISLVPITHGSGTRLKIIESIFSGCQVLSTHLGAEGIDSSLVTKVDLDNFIPSFLRLISDKGEMNQKDLKKILDHFDIDSWYENNEKELRTFMGLSK